jgi:hypothetical protein
LFFTNNPYLPLKVASLRGECQNEVLLCKLAHQPTAFLTSTGTISLQTAHEFIQDYSNQRQTTESCFSYEIEENFDSKIYVIKNDPDVYKCLPEFILECSVDLSFGDTRRKGVQMSSTHLEGKEKDIVLSSFVTKVEDLNQAFSETLNTFYGVGSEQLIIGDWTLLQS